MTFSAAVRICKLNGRITKVQGWEKEGRSRKHDSCPRLYDSSYANEAHFGSLYLGKEAPFKKTKVAEL